MHALYGCAWARISLGANTLVQWQHAEHEPNLASVVLHHGWVEKHSSLD